MRITSLERLQNPVMADQSWEHRSISKCIGQIGGCRVAIGQALLAKHTWLDFADNSYDKNESCIYHMHGIIKVIVICYRTGYLP